MSRRRQPTRRLIRWSTFGRIPASPRRLGARAAVAVALALGLSTTVLATPGAATWSLVAVDGETGEVGLAMAGCGAVAVLGDPDAVLDPVALVPGRGVAVAQAAVQPDRVAQLARLLQDTAVGRSEDTDAGVVAARSAQELLDQVAQPSDDVLIANRQYAIAALGGGAAVFTGDEVGAAGLGAGRTDTYSGARAGEQAAAQGVLVADAAVVDDALTRFQAAREAGEGLDQALARGLLAGSDAGGDPDCGQQTALYAHLVVASPGDELAGPTTLLTVTVDEDDGRNPVALLVSGLDDGERGWLDAGRGPSGQLSRLVVLAVAVAMAVAAVIIIRLGMGYRFGRRRLQRSHEIGQTD